MYFSINVHSVRICTRRRSQVNQLHYALYKINLYNFDNYSNANK